MIFFLKNVRARIPASYKQGPSASWCALDLEPPKGFSSSLEEIDEFHWPCSRALRQVTAKVKVKQ